MSLDKQRMDISFTKGLNTKTDEKLVMGADLLELENAVFTKHGSLSKRFGYDVLSKRTTGGSEVSKGSALGVYKDELNLFTGDQLYSYSKTNDSWVPKGDVASLIIKDTPIIKNGYQQSNVSANALDNISVYAWDDSRGGVRYSCIDHQTNTAHRFDDEISTSGANPKVVILGDYLCIFYTDSTNDLVFRYVAKNTPSDISIPIIVTSDMNATNNYDVALNGDRVFVVYHDDTSTITIRTVDDSFFISGATFLPHDPIESITVVVDESQNIWIAFADSTSVQAMSFSFTLVPILPVTVIETIDNISNITGVVRDSELKIWYTREFTPKSNNHILSSAVTDSGSVTNYNIVIRSLSLASKAFLQDGVAYLNTLYESDLQSTYFTIMESGTVVGKMSAGTSGENNSNCLLTEVPEIDSGQFLFGRQEKTKIESENADLFSVKGVYSTLLEFVSDNTFQNAELGQLHLVGGVLQSYDGVSVTENNFHLYPELEAAAQLSGGLMVDGTYSYQVCYEWTDNLGQVHISSPSLPIAVQISGGGGSGSVDLSINALRITNKKNKRSPIRIAIYRTEANGTVYYRVNSVTNPLYNDVEVDVISYTDQVNDDDILANEPLYTTGGFLENTAPPACSLIETYKNRIFIAGLPDPLEFWYSKERIAGSPAEFTSFFSKRVDSFGGPITALATMDSNILIFKENAIYAISGDGPNDLGGGSDYGNPELITTDVGCTDPNSIVVVPSGIMFKSSKGIYIIGRNFQTNYIGDRVEKYNGLTFSGSKLIPTTNQVRFTTKEGTTLMYDYYFNQWGIFTNQQAYDCDVWDGKFVFLKENGQVWKESDHFSDNNLSISMKITTSWMSLAGVQGFQRIYRMFFLGDYKSSHKMLVSIGYDFNPNFEQFATVDIDEVYPIQKYGDSSPYGKDFTQYGYGGGYPLYEFNTRMTKQKCTSVRFSFQDSQTYETEFGESFSLANIALEVGVKNTLRKYSSGSSFGTS